MAISQLRAGQRGIESTIEAIREARAEIVDPVRSRLAGLHQDHLSMPLADLVRYRWIPFGDEVVGKPYGGVDLLRLAYAYEKEANPRKPPESAPPFSVELLSRIIEGSWPDGTFAET